VPLRARPTRYALAKFLASVELPTPTPVRQLREDDDPFAFPANGGLKPVIADEKHDNGVFGYVFDLRQTLEQHLELLIPPADSEQWHSAHEQFDLYWSWLSSDDDESNKDEKAASDSETQAMSDTDEPSATARDGTVLGIMSGDGFPLTENPKRSMTLLRMGIGNPRVLQQSCDNWPLVAAIETDEHDPVVRLAMRFFEPQIEELRRTGITVHGRTYRVMFKSGGDLAWRSEVLKGQLGHSATHFDSSISTISLKNKHQLHLLRLSEASLNSFHKRLADKQQLDAAFEDKVKARRKPMTAKRAHDLRVEEAGV
jgi:hypothetical protein